MSRRRADGCTDPTGRWWLIFTIIGVGLAVVWWLS